MAKLTDRTELTTPADGDFYVTTDVSDTTDAATGTDKKITWANLKAGFKTYFDTLYAGVLGADDNYVTDAEKTKLSNISITQAVDLDALETASHAAVTKTGTATYISLSGQQITADPIDTTDLAAGVLDTDLSAVSASDDTVPSAKATKAALDLKAPLASPTFTGTFTLPTGLTGVIRADSGVVSVDSDVTDIVAAASDTAAGKVELATPAECTTGTDTARAVTPEGLKTVADTKLPLAGGTMSGNITLGENTSIDLDPAGSADGKYSGICITGTAGTTLAFGDLIYLAAADSRWELADADAATTADRLLGICVLAAAADGNATKILLMGNIRADAAFPALTIGSPVYVGETAGDVQTAIPTGADNVIRRVGFALTADELYFNPSQDVQTTVA